MSSSLVPKRYFPSLLGLVVLLLASSMPASSLSAQPPLLPPEEPPLFAPGQLLVLLGHGSGAPAPDTVVEAQRHRKPLPGNLGVGGPESVRYLITERAQGRALRTLREVPDSSRARLQRYLVFDYPAQANVDKILEALLRNPNVEHAHRSRVFQLSAQPVTPDDPLFPVQASPQDYQWGLHALNMEQAWGYAKGHGYVGIIDTGLQTDHEDLRPFDAAGNYVGGNFRDHFSHDFGDVTGTGCTPNATELEDRICDDDVDEMEGTTSSLAGHGTHVAGIIAANSDNGVGVAGVCWHCSILMEKMVNDFKSFTFEPNAVNAFAQLVDYGAQVVNMSFGFIGTPRDCTNSSLDAFCLQLDVAEDRDVASFAAAGNFLDDLAFPASDERTISVGGLEPSLSFWDFRDSDPRDCPYPPTLNECGSSWTQSATAADQDFVAPAVDVLSTFYQGATWNGTVGCADNTYPTAGYGLCTGTSMATPHGTGLGGLLRSVNPLLDKEQIRDVINSNADRAGSWDPQFGFGLPDAAASVHDTLGRTDGVVLDNRLTPLFALWSPVGEDYFYTTVPQAAAAKIWEDVIWYSVIGADFSVIGRDVGGYGYFPGTECVVGPCLAEPGAEVYVFSTDRSPNGHPLVPLYRMSFVAASGGNPDNADHTYTTEDTGIEAFAGSGYRLDGVEGYIYERCTPEPSCIPDGAVRLYRLYNAARDDWAVFPETELAAYQTDGYSSQPCCNDWIGYVYENVDTDFDNVIDGFETLAGTNPLVPDTDCDGSSDGTEMLDYGTSGYGDPLDGPCVALNVLISDDFTGSGALDGRQTPVGSATWEAKEAAIYSADRVLDRTAVGGVPFDPFALPGSPTVSVSAAVDPSDSISVAVGFSSQAIKAYQIASDLFVRLWGNGTYTVFAEGSSQTSGTIPGTPSGGHHLADVRYDVGSGLGEVLLNGVQVFSQVLGSVPNIQYAGFHMQGATQGTTELDDFQVATVDSGVNVLIADSFSSNGFLDGRQTEVGAVTWDASEAALASGGRVLDQTAIGGVPFDPFALPGRPTVAVTAEIDPTSSLSVAVGFSSLADKAYQIAGQLFVRLSGDDEYQVYADGSFGPLNTIPGSPVGGYHHAEVRYNTASGRAVILVNGVEVLSQILTMTPDIHYAGFHMAGAAQGAARLDDFQVLATTAP